MNAASDVRGRVETMLSEAGIDPAFISAYDEPGRWYHTWAHVEQVLRDAGADPGDPSHLQLVLAVVFHDAVYVPGREDNEALSAALFEEMCTSALTPEGRAEVVRAILDTKTHRPSPGNRVSAALCRADMLPLLEGSMSSLLRSERLLFKEFQRFNYKDYVAGRLTFLESVAAANPEHAVRMRDYAEAISEMRPNVAVMVSAFSDVDMANEECRRLEGSFDKVVLAPAASWRVSPLFSAPVGSDWSWREWLQWWNADSLVKYDSGGTTTFVISHNDYTVGRAMSLHDVLRSAGRSVLLMPQDLRTRRFTAEELSAGLHG